MGIWKIYDYVGWDGENDILNWSKSLQSGNLGRLNRKIKMLEDNGPDLGPNLLAGPIKGYAHIYKLKVRGNVQLRPLLCYGPLDNDIEFTFLKGAVEVGNEYSPKSAPSEAQIRRQEVIDDGKHDGKNRRCDHVKVGK
jgi:hypothetical protein